MTIKEKFEWADKLLSAFYNSLYNKERKRSTNNLIECTKDLLKVIELPEEFHQNYLEAIDDEVAEWKVLYNKKS